MSELIHSNPLNSHWTNKTLKLGLNIALSKTDFIVKTTFYCCPSVYIIAFCSV